MKFLKSNDFANPLSILIWLTLIAVVGQIAFFGIHIHVSDLMDSLVQSSLKSEIFHFVILGPIIQFILIQFFAYAFFILWVWFLSLSLKELFHLSQFSTFILTVGLWLTHCCVILSLNNYFYNESFFAQLLPTPFSFLILSLTIAIISAFFAYFYCFWKKRHIIFGLSFLVMAFVFFSGFFFKPTSSLMQLANNQKPNIILIGLDSVRPDFVGYFGGKSRTPQIDYFLKTATVFTNAYTPLARTFPAWMSILTAQYPIHNHARSNLADPNSIHANETLAYRLKKLGYETIYATDEKRFSNITSRYGFDRLIGPEMGVNDFILGGLSDFPLTNLLVNTSLGKILFPFNFANRAAAVTYEPDKFLNLVKSDLPPKNDKPLFLAIHLCVSHWPFTWAQDHQSARLTLPERYQASVEAVDTQLGQLLALLKEKGLLQNSLVFLLSDHGTSLGIRGDRFISEKNFHGDRNKLHWLIHYKLSSAPDFSINFAKDYTISTAYGQGTDVLSLKQYQVLLALKQFGDISQPKVLNHPVSLLDIAPTILDFLHQPRLTHSDGESLFVAERSHPIFLESGHSLSEIEKKDIFVEQVVKHAIGVYQIDPKTGQLYVKPEAEKAIVNNKQRAILLGDWLLARYPESTQTRIVFNHNKLNKPAIIHSESYQIPAFFVLANTKTGQWSIDLDSSVAKQAPATELKNKLKDFYGKELH